MVTVSKGTLSDSALTFIRDVLRNEITDPSNNRTSSQWIWQSRPEANFDDPFVVIDEIDNAEEAFSISDTTRRTFPPELMYSIDVWSRTIGTRDSVSDSIIQALQDGSSTDGTNDLASQGLIYQSSTRENADTTVGEDASTMRIKNLTVTFIYRGL